jgi:NADPH-dependent curcumin reductase CurA
MISKEIHLKYKLSQHVSEYDFNIVDVELPEIELGEFLVKNLYCSTDPFMRSNMSFEGGFFRMEPNAPLYGESIGIVEESKCSDYPVGTYVWHNKGWREYGICKDTTAILKVKPDLDSLDE